VGFSGISITPPGNAFIYSNGIMTALAPLSFNGWSEAYAINNNGEVVGQSPNSTTPDACLWSGGKITDLGNMGGSFSLAWGINDNGDIVGYCGTNGYGSLAFLYTNGVMVGLDTLSNSSAFGINNARQIVGWSTLSGKQHAFLYSAGTTTDLGTLGGTTSLGRGINNAGQVVGSASLANGQTHAFLYSEGTMTDLGALPNYQQTDAYSINNSGQVVGSAHSTTAYHAFIYDKGTMTDLNNLISPNSGWVVSVAQCINDNGQIVGYGSNPSHQHHAFLLTPYMPATLTVGVSNSSLVVSWPTNKLTFNLFQNSDLSTTNWTVVTNTPTVTNGQNQVVIPSPLAGNCFYRLISN
jgi:probable HAF family extracellular repeat protein